MLQRLTYVSIIALVALVSGVVALKFWVEKRLEIPMHIPAEGYVLDVQPGSSLSQLSRALADQGMLESPYPLLIYSRIGKVPQIMAGEYALESGLSSRELIQKLGSGDVIRYQITFPEGLNVRQWLAILNGNELFTHKPPLQLADLEQEFDPPQGDNLEGWFFPDTYMLSSSDSAISVLERAHRRMVEVVNEEWASRAPELPLETPYQALILASIIEKETGKAEERAAIAGVFIRRLKNGMRLQTDPTVIYGLGENFNGNLTRSHLREATPYNTYVIDGLPPTPISNPGRESIHAALNPREGTEIYFVARGDGSHEFSSTLAEHRRAVREFQLKRVKDYRSSPK